MHDSHTASSSSPNSAERIPCPNCSAAIDARHRHCTACGCKTRPERLTFRMLWETSVEHFLSLDFPIARTAIGLMRAPGRVAREYIAGRRAHYTNPLKYNLITAVLLVFMAQWYLGYLRAGAAQPAPRSIASWIILEAGTLSQQWHNDYLQLVYVLTLPLLALMMRGALGRRSRRITMEFYVMLLYAFGQVYIFQAACITIIWLATMPAIEVVFGITSAAFPYFYIPWMTIGFTGLSVWRAGAISVLMFILYSSAIGVMMLIAGLLVVTLRLLY